MGLDAIFDPRNWAPVPFHFWSLVFFILGSIVGSFLNVCIHRMPLGMSVISPPSHCPYCKYSIPWFLNIPLVTWLSLGGKCKNCSAPISPRYFLVELLTGITFLSCWLVFGRQSAFIALVYSFFLAGLIAATFIDFEHFIIPDEITIGGTVIGFVCSFLVPALHQAESITTSMKRSVLGIVVGGGLIYLILRLGKLMFGRQRVELPEDTKIIFSETAVHLPDKDILYEELFYRPSDVITLQARTVELIDRGYRNVLVRLSPKRLLIGDEQLNPEEVPHMEAVCAGIVLPREAMGFGDVKFMAAIGAFLGWQAVVFALLASSLIGSLIGVSLIVLRRREWSSRLPYGPYIAAAAATWILLPASLQEAWAWNLRVAAYLFFRIPLPDANSPTM
jgi:leader peptidase (prepilin peptidase)/N-methyltransferase